MIHANLQKLCGVSALKIYGIGKLNQIPATCFTSEIVFALPLPMQSAKTFCAFCQYIKIICALHNALHFLYML